MKICGLQKTTLLDYPEHVAATIFMGGCNFCCPFCHNSGLLGADCDEIYTAREVLEFLARRASILEGVCLTGGEPTLQTDLEPFIREIRDLGYLIKLDTNGCRPDVLKDLCGKRVIDYVAMDIKNSRERYGETCGLPGLSMKNIEESVEFLMEGLVPYEFRTTVTRELHSAEDFRLIGKWLRGCARYYLQPYKDSEQVLERRFTSYGKEELEEFVKILKREIPVVCLRGIDD